MIWLTWRQYRWMFILGMLALAIVISLFILEAHAVTAASQNPRFAYCFKERNVFCVIPVFPGMTMDGWSNLVHDTFFWLPFIVGCFLGAPLLTREYEQRTHLFVWTQSISRTRWLSRRLLVVGGAVFFGFGVLSLVATWWRFVQDSLVAGTSPWSDFEMGGGVFVANVLFSLMLGVAVGALIRRTLPAMLITLVLLIPIQIVIPAWYPYLFPPSSQIDYPFDTGPAGTTAYDNPQDLIVARDMVVVGADGKTHVADPLYNPCPGLTGEALRQCNQRSYHDIVWYHRFSEHFWPLQLVMTAVLLALTALCTGITYWLVRRQI